VDIEKLKYDLSLQCALVDSIKSYPDDLRKFMLERFKSYLTFYNMLDDSYFYDLPKPEDLPKPKF